MAAKDIGRGWGTLPGHLTEWTCCKCQEASRVFDWNEKQVEFNQRLLEGRECPKCKHVMASLGCTDEAYTAHTKRLERILKESKLVPKPESAVKQVAKPKAAKKKTTPKVKRG